MHIPRIATTMPAIVQAPIQHAASVATSFDLDHRMICIDPPEMEVIFGSDMSPSRTAGFGRPAPWGPAVAASQRSGRLITYGVHAESSAIVDTYRGGMIPGVGMQPDAAGTGFPFLVQRYR